MVEEIIKLAKELEYAYSYLDSVTTKLEDDKFVRHAPAEVVKAELIKKLEAHEKIAFLVNEIKNN